MIDLAPDQLERVKRILAEHVPSCEVRAFGSRVTRTAKKWSDLDAVVVGPEKLDRELFYRLKEAFEESELPIQMDLLDWHTISPEFQTVINQGYEILQPSAG